MYNELEAYTSQELIGELVARPTWVGVLIQSQTEAKPPLPTVHQKFELCFNNEILDVTHVRMLLEGILEELPTL